MWCPDETQTCGGSPAGAWVRTHTDQLTSRSLQSAIVLVVVKMHRHRHRHRNSEAPPGIQGKLVEREAGHWTTESLLPAQDEVSRTIA